MQCHITSDWQSQNTNDPDESFDLHYLKLQTNSFLSKHHIFSEY